MKIINVKLAMVMLLMSCSESEVSQKSFLNDIKNEKKEIESIFKGNIVIILARDTKVNDTNISIQDYNSGEGSFIPVFTSISKLKESTKGVNLGKPIMEISGLFFLSILNGNETIRVNPELNDEKILKAANLKNQFLMELKKYKKTTDSLKKVHS